MRKLGGRQPRDFLIPHSFCMHVLITTPSYPPASGGVANVAQRQAKHLAHRGHRVTVITSGTAEDDRLPAQEGLTLIRLPVRTGRFPAYAAGDGLGVQQPALRSRYQELLLQSDADLLVSHCWQAWNTDWAVDVAERLRFPFCLYSHGTSVNDTSGRTGWLRWLRWRHYASHRLHRSLRAISLLVTLDAQADRNRFYDVTVARQLGTAMAVVPNCASPELELAAPWRPDGVLTRHMVLSVGQYNAGKNPAQVLDAFLRNAPSDWTLVLCGSHRTKYLRALEKRYATASARRPAPSVQFLVGLTQLQLMGLYKRADLFVAASRTECQPLVILDAMASGVPFLSTDVGCVRSLPGGLVSRNAADFAAKAGNLMREPELRATLSAAGSAAHESTYNCAATRRHLEAVLIDAVAGAGARGA